MSYRLKSCWNIFRLKIYIAWLDFQLFVLMPLIKWIGFVVIIATTPLWLIPYCLIERKRIKDGYYERKERENKNDR